jgi:hypothetical protein
MFCLHKFHWSPSYFVNLPQREKIMVMAMIDTVVEAEKREMAKAKRGR